MTDLVFFNLLLFVIMWFICYAVTEEGGVSFFITLILCAMFSIGPCAKEEPKPEKAKLVSVPVPVAVTNNVVNIITVVTNFVPANPAIPESVEKQ
jgi:hypothetical protein